MEWQLLISEVPLYVSGNGMLGLLKYKEALLGREFCLGQADITGTEFQSTNFLAMKLPTQHDVY